MARILVVDDERDLREIIVETLMYEYYEVDSAVNGIEAVEKALQDPPDLIICDIMMPHMDGRQVLERLRANPATAATPFIFLSALDGRDTIRTGMNLGADDYLVKPVDTDELLTAVSARLRHHAQIKADAGQSFEQLKHQLARMATHELRTPLVSINTVIDVLSRQRGQLEPEAFDDLLNTMRVGASRLSHRVEQIAYLTQLDAGLLTAEQVVNGGMVMPLWDLLLTSVNIAKKFAIRQQPNVNIKLVDVDREAQVCVNPSALKHALAELIANALTFSPANAEVRIVQKRVERGVRLSITDAGPGITREQLVSALEMFQQIDRDKQEQQGMGLGLPLAQRLIEVHQGELEIRSIPGKGTQVLVVLPEAL